MSKFVKLLVFLSVFFLFVAPSAKADDPFPPPPIECDNTTQNPEFHSLRPYQASANCQSSTSSLATFCGNNLTLKNTIHVTYDPADSNCSVNGNQVTCKYSRHIDDDIRIDLSGASLPFMGNTEDVINSQTSAETLDDAEKVNGYVNWYLAGITHKAEYGTDKNGGNDLINFSGPINKLLPGVILDAQRIKTIDNFSEGTNHDQIVVCANGSNPVDCYKGDKSAAQPTAYKLSDWNGRLSWSNDVINFFVKIFPLVPRDLIEKSFGDHWNKRQPPLPWKDENGKPFEEQVLYEKAYNEWRGKTCIIVPVINHLFCAESFLVPNKYSDLYAYIPLSSTEDLKGSVLVDSVAGSGSGANNTEITNVGFLGQVPAELFYAHMAENNELSTLLQETYAGKGVNIDGGPNNIDTQGSCSTVEVRSNKGDNLFAGEIKGTLSYDAKFTCNYSVTGTSSNNYSCRICNSSGQCVTNPGSNQVSCNHDLDECEGPSDCTGGSTPTQKCDVDVYLTLSTKSNSPNADSVWNKLVAGDASVFKRIAPKVGEGAPVSCILDIPGATNITYAGREVGVQNTDLKLPHLGGISEYFLNGIQSFLRPKGFGEERLASGTQCSTANSLKDCQGESSNPIPSKYDGTFKQNFIDKANAWSAKCPGPENNLADECYNFVVNKSIEEGVNPAFSLAIWLNESDASNYCLSSNVQDFGINISSMVMNIQKQIEIFLNMSNERLCEGSPGFSEPMQGWLSRFKSISGTCDASYVPGITYYNNIKDGAWSFVTGCAKNGRFGITWPTDSSCP